MNKKLLFTIGLLAVFLLITGQALAQVTVWGEGAWTDTDVQICIYANIPDTDALRSFGVRLVYNPSELIFDGSKSTKNEAVWYFGDGTNNEHYMDPTDVEVDSNHRAVITIGGILDTNDTGKKVSGDRVLLATIWFTRPTGASGPLSSSLTLELGKPDPFDNFVVDSNTVLDESVTFEAVNVFERGDANGDGAINALDAAAIRDIFFAGGGVYYCYADCNNDGSINALDFACVRDKFFGK